MQVKRQLFVFALLCLSFSCASSDRPTAIAVDRLPDGWDPLELLALVGELDVIKTVENEIDIVILAWKVEENDSPQRIESALVWALFRAGDAEDWMLAQVIRATDTGGVPSPWSLAVWKGTPQVSHDYYKQAPGADEVRRFMRATWWTDKASAGNRLVDSAVRSVAWTSVIGAPPVEPGG